MFSSFTKVQSRSKPDPKEASDAWQHLSHISTWETGLGGWTGWKIHLLQVVCSLLNVGKCCIVILSLPKGSMKTKVELRLKYAKSGDVQIPWYFIREVPFGCSFDTNHRGKTWGWDPNWGQVKFSNITLKSAILKGDALLHLAKGPQLQHFIGSNHWSIIAG